MFASGVLWEQEQTWAGLRDSWMIIGVAESTADWKALHRVYCVFGLMVDFRDGRMVMMMIAFRESWIAGRAARRIADYAAVN